MLFKARFQEVSVCMSVKADHVLRQKMKEVSTKIPSTIHTAKVCFKRESDRRHQCCIYLQQGLQYISASESMSQLFCMPFVGALCSIITKACRNPYMMSSL